MPEPEVSSFPSKLYFSLFTISCHWSPYFATPLTPSFPNVFSPNQLQGEPILYPSWFLPIHSFLPSFPKAITLIQVLILFHSDHIFQLLFILWIFFENLSCTRHLRHWKYSRGKMRQQPCSDGVYMLFQGEKKQIQGLQKGIKKKKHSHPCLLDWTTEEVYHNPKSFVS